MSEILVTQHLDHFTIKDYEVVGKFKIPVVEKNGVTYLKVEFLLLGKEFYKDVGNYELEEYVTIEQVKYKTRMYNRDSQDQIQNWINENQTILLELFTEHIRKVCYVKRKKGELKEFYKTYKQW
jgi:hypothetical protein